MPADDDMVRRQFGAMHTPTVVLTACLIQSYRSCTQHASSLNNLTKAYHVTDNDVKVSQVWLIWAWCHCRSCTGKREGE